MSRRWVRAGRPSGGAGYARLRRWYDDRRGLAGIEFALIAPVLFLLLVGMVDYGQLMFQTMQVNAAAQAGAGYAAHNCPNSGTCSSISSAIQTAVIGATPLTVTATPAPQFIKACVTGGAIVTTAGSTCASGGPPGYYVVVGAQATFSPYVAGPGILMPTTISASVTVRSS